VNLEEEDGALVYREADPVNEDRWGCGTGGVRHIQTGTREKTRSPGRRLFLASREAGCGGGESTSARERGRDQPGITPCFLRWIYELIR